MAKVTSLRLMSSLDFLAMICLLFYCLVAGNDEVDYSSTEESGYPNSQCWCPKPEKYECITLYWHNIHTGINPSAIESVHSPTNYPSPFPWGTMDVFSNKMTETQDISSQTHAVAHGLYTSVSSNPKPTDDVILQIYQSIVMKTGKCKGSTINVGGHDPVKQTTRTIPISGGTGCYKYAHGEATLTAVTFDPFARNGTVKYHMCMNYI